MLPVRTKSTRSISFYHGIPKKVLEVEQSMSRLADNQICHPRDVHRAQAIVVQLVPRRGAGCKTSSLDRDLSQSVLQKPGTSGEQHNKGTN